VAQVSPADPLAITAVRNAGDVTCGCWLGPSSNEFATGHHSGDIFIWGCPSSGGGGSSSSAGPAEAVLVAPMKVVQGMGTLPVQSLQFVSGRRECLLVFGGGDEDHPPGLVLLPLAHAPAPRVSRGAARGLVLALPVCCSSRCSFSGSIAALAAAALAVAAGSSVRSASSGRAWRAGSRPRWAPGAHLPTHLQEGSDPDSEAPEAPCGDSKLKLPWFGAIKGFCLVPDRGCLTGYEDPAAVVVLTEGGELIVQVRGRGLLPLPPARRCQGLPGALPRSAWLRAAG
jgi:hypothetical protein